MDKMTTEHGLLARAAITMRVIASDSVEPGERELAREWLDAYAALPSAMPAEGSGEEFVVPPPDADDELAAQEWLHSDSVKFRPDHDRNKPCRVCTDMLTAFAHGRAEGRALKATRPSASVGQEAQRTITEFITPVLMDVANMIDSPAVPNMARQALRRLPNLEAALALRQQVTEEQVRHLAAEAHAAVSYVGSANYESREREAHLRIDAALTAALNLGEK